MPQHRPLLEDDFQDKILNPAQERAWQHLQRILDALQAAPPRPPPRTRARPLSLG